MHCNVNTDAFWNSQGLFCKCAEDPAAPERGCSYGVAAYSDIYIVWASTRNILVQQEIWLQL